MSFSSKSMELVGLVAQLTTHDMGARSKSLLVSHAKIDKDQTAYHHGPPRKKRSGPATWNSQWQRKSALEESLVFPTTILPFWLKQTLACYDQTIASNVLWGVENDLQKSDMVGRSWAGFFCFSSRSFKIWKLKIADWSLWKSRLCY